MYFTDVAQTIIDSAVNIKVKNACVLHVSMEVENVPFNKGFYSVDMTYYFLVRISVYLPNTCLPTTLNGLAVFNKKAILFGSEGNVRSFSSNTSCQELLDDGINNHFSVPEAVIQVVEPIILGTRVTENCCCEEAISVPEYIANHFEGDFNNIRCSKNLLVSLGVFSIVSLKRDVQVMMPVYDFCVPDKECTTNSNDDPCDLFKRIKFPVNEFFPPRLIDLDDDGDSSCGNI